MDLPEIEDFPQTTCSILSSGKLSIKKKAISDLNKDYATSVIGMAFFFAGVLFNISPKIENIQISGYTQRLSKKSGNTEDQYVYSINFSRTSFANMNIQNIDPLEAITNFEHSIDISSKYELKTISHDRLIDKTNLSEDENNVSSDSTPSNNLNNEKPSNEGDFCYSPQQVIDDYNSDFDCYYLRPDVIETKKRENKKAVTKKILWSLLAIAILGVSCCYYFSHADERQLKKASKELLSSNHINIIETRLHADSTYYYLYSNSGKDTQEEFITAFNSLYEKTNPVIFVLKKDSTSIINYIDSYYASKREIPDSKIVDCADTLSLAFNTDANQTTISYPLKETDFYKKFMEEKRKQEELAAKEARERAERQSKIRANNYLYTRTKPEIHYTKINPNKGIKNNTKSQDITVLYVYAYCPKGQSSSQLIDDIRKMERTSYIRIYIYDKKYSSYEIQKGEIDGHKDYTYVPSHRIAKWFFD
ncbi:MAG: hypothetical protein IJ207_09775 [Treponema sp.]|uniref:hypothetical protein n=1 Tax=Treponema sp. TaxID=166 RepID=UPI0025F83B63|nr:hypothetical protein [Treponema sp.]MBQ9282471.1 hypothetical protein [Treponema sp.]